MYSGYLCHRGEGMSRGFPSSFDYASFLIFILSLFTLTPILQRILHYFTLTKCDPWCAYRGS